MMKWIPAGLLAAALIAAVWSTVSFVEPPGAPPAQVEGAIVSLSPSTTEIVYALRLEDRLVGVSTACDHPPAVREIRKAGDFGAPRLVRLRHLRPSLVVTTRLRDPEHATAIRQLGAELVVAPQDSLNDVLEAVLKIGQAAGMPGRAEAYADRLRDRIAAATPSIPQGGRPRVFVELSAKPLRTAGKGSFLDDLIRRAGGRNIADDLEPAWLKIGADRVVARDPEIIIVAHPIRGDARAVMARRIGFAGVAAVRHGRVVTNLDPDLILRPGPRLADGLERLAQLFEQYREEQAR
jgi:iron complex transport system substrate-binding protein